MVGKRNQISSLIRGRPFFACHFQWTSRRGPVTYRLDETHKVGQPPESDWSVTKVTFDELWIYSRKGEEMKGLNQYSFID